MSFHSTNFPSEWGVDSMSLLEIAALHAAIEECFHSTNFPSEWGAPDIRQHKICRNALIGVSIQLISPASGETSGISFKGARF